MSHSIIKSIFAAAALASVSTAMAHADCESDLGLIEAALAAPNLKPEAKAALEAAGAAGAAALKKDDDATCNKAVMDGLAKAGAAPSATPAAVATNTASLGDLSAFKAIAADTLKIVNGGDNAGAKTRIKDLESLWDKSAKSMKSANLDKWNMIDKALDVTFRTLRAASPKATDSATVLQSLIALLDKTT